MRAKKSLGQHFLTSQNIAKLIAETSSLSGHDTALEIGPGTGILTKELVKRAGHTIAIEKDGQLVERLKKKFADEIAESKLALVHGDALDLEPGTLRLEHRNYVVVANIPYYITGALIEKFLSGAVQPKRMVLLLQREVAKRIVAKDKKESVLSISVKAYGEPRYIRGVSARNFTPIPKVDSAILSIENISRDFFDGIDENKFFTLVRAGFAHKRKLLVNNIVPLFKNRAETESSFTLCDIPHGARAETLSPKNWKCLVQKL